MKDSEIRPRSPRERGNQKRRTRDAILGGARAMMERGETVTVAGAAAEAGVSKATAYRYFPEPSALAAESVLALAVLPFEEIVAGVTDLRARLVRLNLYFFDLACEHETSFRQFLARSLDVSRADGAPRRGARRIAMYLRAMDEDGATPGAVRAPLARALAVNTGIETVIALFDVAGASRDEARDTVRIVAEAVIDRYLKPDG